MRFIILFALMAVFYESALAATPASIVINYECGQIPKETGFTCQKKERKYNSGFAIVWHENPADMKPKRKERAVYEFNNLALRIVSLGVPRFYVRIPNQADDMIKSCKATKNGVSYICQWFKCKDYADGGSSCEPL